MRYLVTSDLHYNLPQLDWIAEQAPDYDAVVFAGDHLDGGGYAGLDAQVAMFIAYFGELATVTTVIASSGNHDLANRREDGEKAALWMQRIDQRVHRDGANARLGGDLVSVCAWWEGPATLAEVEAQLEAAAAERVGRRWFWVYHSPPDLSPTSWSGTRHYGDDVLNALIERHQPDIVLTGHVHEAPFRPDGSWHDRIGATLVLNAGRHAGPIPEHLMLDTDAGEVAWWSLDGHGELAL